MRVLIGSESSRAIRFNIYRCETCKFNKSILKQNIHFKFVRFKDRLKIGTCVSSTYFNHSLNFDIILLLTFYQLKSYIYTLLPDGEIRTRLMFLSASFQN